VSSGENYWGQGREGEDGGESKESSLKTQMDWAALYERGEMGG